MPAFASIFQILKMILFSVFCETDRWSRVNGEADEIKCGQVEEDIRVNSSPIQYAISLSTLITASYLVLCSMSVFFIVFFSGLFYCLCFLNYRVNRSPVPTHSYRLRLRLRLFHSVILLKEKKQNLDNYHSCPYYLLH